MEINVALVTVTKHILINTCPRLHNCHVLKIKYKYIFEDIRRKHHGKDAKIIYYSIVFNIVYSYNVFVKFS
jgi:hypothetical protein